MTVYILVKVIIIEFIAISVTKLIIAMSRGLSIDHFYFWALKWNKKAENRIKLQNKPIQD